ncbi:MAG: Transposase Tn5 dimerization domain, partial [Planctomycetota bacterium]
MALSAGVVTLVSQRFCICSKLGGFLARKHDGEPGWQSIWSGYEKLHARIEGIKLV